MPKRIAIRWIVDKTTGCWLWQLKLNHKGYAYENLLVNGVYKKVRVHKKHWVEQHGPVPPGLMLDHKCRVRRCVNPDHLELVTHTENCRRGAQTRLTREDVLEIHRLRKNGVRAVLIAKQFGICDMYVYEITRGRWWADVYAEV